MDKKDQHFLCSTMSGKFDENGQDLNIYVVFRFIMKLKIVCAQACNKCYDCNNDCSEPKPTLCIKRNCNHRRNVPYSQETPSDRNTISLWQHEILYFCNYCTKGEIFVGCFAQPPINPDLTPPDFHLFRFLRNFLNGKNYQSLENIKIHLDVSSRVRMKQFGGIL